MASATYPAVGVGHDQASILALSAILPFLGMELRIEVADRDGHHKEPDARAAGDPGRQAAGERHSDEPVEDSRTTTT